MKTRNDRIVGGSYNVRRASGRETLPAAIERVVSVAAALILSVSIGHATEDAAAGQKVFATHCGGCHDTTPGGERIGPSLAGVFGRRSGTQPGFAYSPALKTAGIVWSEETIDAFLKNPTRDVRGTRMFANLPDPTDRQNVIAYLKTLPHG